MKGKAYVVPTLVVVLGPQVTSIIKWHSRKPNHTRQSEWVSVRESWFSSETHTLARPLPYSQFSLLQKSHTISFYYLPLVAAFAYKHLRSLSLSLSLQVCNVYVSLINSFLTTQYAHSSFLSFSHSLDPIQEYYYF